MLIPLPVQLLPYLPERWALVNPDHNPSLATKLFAAERIRPFGESLHRCDDREKLAAGHAPPSARQ
jgi:hypothetical protein